jgi:branched-chain amino acid transport system substrate-binding protein
MTTSFLKSAAARRHCGVAILFFATILSSVAPAAAQQAPIKVGLFLELTGGSSGLTSEAAKFGAELAIQEINAANGINGRKIVAIVADTQTDATVGVGEIKRLVLQEKVDFIIGPVISQIQMAAAPVLNDGKVASVGSTGSLLITPKLSPYYFSTLISADAQAKSMAARVADSLKAKSVAILSDAGAQAKDFVEAIKTEFAARNITITGLQEHQYRATDMTPQLLALRRGAPETLIIFNSSGEDAGNALKSLNELGWDISVTGNWTFGSFADAAEGIAGAEAMAKTTGMNYRGFTYCGGETPKAYLDFAKKANAANAALAKRLSLPFVAIFYDAMMMFKAAAEGTNGKLDGPSIAEWIENNASKVQGISAPTSASKDSHFLYGPDALVTVYPLKRGESGIQQRVGC